MISTSQPGDWLTVTPDGLFDGSTAGWKEVFWHFATNTLDVAPVEIFFSEFFYPGLVADIFAERPLPATEIASKDRRQPRVDLAIAEPPTDSNKVVSSRIAKVRVEVAEQPADNRELRGSGVRDVRLFRNGSLVKIWHGPAMLDNDGKAVLETEIAIVAGENRLAAYAFNRDNIKSTDATLLVKGSDKLRRAGTFYILAVGINEYANSEYELKYAAADAQEIGEELRAQQIKFGSFERVEVVDLLNKDATKPNILLALSRLAGTDQGALPIGVPAAVAELKTAQPEDAVVIYFAGHGTTAQERFYLVPHDLGYSGPRENIGLAGLKQLLAHSISDEELEPLFEKIDAGHLLLIIDACNSGQALEAEEKRRGPMNSKGLAQLAYEKGMYILAAAQGYQEAREDEHLGHGLLTYVLVEEGLKTRAAASSDDQILVPQWLDFATQRVPQIQEAMMEEATRCGRKLGVSESDQSRGPSDETQRPRAFYRREPEPFPLVLAKVPAK